jgi:phosphoribosyl-dephospho-CoA transferase
VSRRVVDFLPPRTALDCRARAEQCARNAAITTDKNIRAMFLDLVDQWTFLADQIERLKARERRR